MNDAVIDSLASVEFVIYHTPLPPPELIHVQRMQNVSIVL